MNQKLCFILIACAGWLTGCDKTVQDYVNITPAITGNGSGFSPDQGKDLRAVKVSPGHAVTTGAQYRADLTVTPTQHVVTGSHYRAELSISQQRH